MRTGKKSLLALVKKNALLKWVNKGSSLVEFTLPILMFFLLTSIIHNFQAGRMPAQLVPGDFYKPMTLSKAISELNFGCTQANSASCDKIGIIGKNHPLNKPMVDICLTDSGGIPGPKTDWDYSFQYFDSFDHMVKYIKNQSPYQSRIQIAIEWSQIVPKPLSDLDVNAMNDVPQWGYTIHTDDVDTGSMRSLYDLHKIEPDTRWPGRILSLQVLANQAILRYNGLYGNDRFNSAQNGKYIGLSASDMPYKAYIDKSFLNLVSPIAAGLGAIAFLPSISAIVSVIVQEKEFFLRQSLVMMGASKWSMYLSWFITQYLFSFAPILFISTMLTSYMATNVNFFFVFFIMSFYYLTLVSFCLVISSFFSQTKTAQAVSSILFVLLSLVGAATSSMPDWLGTLLSCVSLQSILGQVMRNLFDMDRLIQFQQIPVWAAMTTSYNGGLNFIWCFFVCFAQVIIYFLLAIYIDNIMPGGYNNPLPFHYPFMPSYWIGSTRNIKTGTDTNPNQSAPLLEPARNRFIRPLTSREDGSVCVRFRNVVKTFKGPGGDDFNAVDNLSTEFLKGELFTLIGHNGAGKSTAINMLTGIYGPTSGRIELYDRNGAMIDPAFSCGRIGVCPQYNALYPKLSVLDHLRLFSAIKQDAMGIVIPEEQQISEFNDILHMLKLGPTFDNKQDSPVENLSGGQKRKTCLAIALLHRPSLLILDEPTTGTDIAVQREIWTLLGQLKHDSCILLSTHHLEEAEVGDRIGIMVKGQMMCCGTAMFLKSQFGVGYALNLEKKRFSGIFDRVTAIDTSVNQNQKDKTFGGAHGAEITTLSGQRLMKILKPQWNQGNLPPLPEELVRNGIELSDDQRGLLQGAINVKLTAQQLVLFEKVTLHSDTQSNLKLSISYNDSDIIPDILDLCEAISTQLNIVDASLSITSLEDVFIMANNGSVNIVPGVKSELEFNPDSDTSDSSDGEELIQRTVMKNSQTSKKDENEPQTKSNSGNNNGKTKHLRVNTSIWDSERPKVAPFTLFITQFLALFYKRALMQTRDKKSLFRLILLPLFLSSLVIIQSNMVKFYPPKEISYEKFPQNTPIYYSKISPPTPNDYSPELISQIHQANKFSQQFASYSSSLPIEDDITSSLLMPKPSQALSINPEKYGQHILDISLQQDKLNPIYTMPLITNATLTPDTFSVQGFILYNSTSHYAPFSFLQRGYETIAEMAGLPQSEKILKKFGKILNLNLTLRTLPNPDMATTTKLLGCTVIIICAFVFPENLIHLLVNERSERVYHLHRISGTGTLAYWLSYFFFDLLIYTFMMGITIGSLLLFKIALIDLDIIILSLAVYGPIVILYTYMLSLLFEKPSSAQVVIMTSLIVGPLVLILVITLVGLAFKYELFWKFYAISLIIPSSGIVWPLIQANFMSSDNTFLWFPQILQKWIIVIPIYFVLFWVLLGIQNKHWLSELFAKAQPIKEREQNYLDPDVISQEEMIKSGQYDPNQYPLVSHGLRKVFGDNTAVNNLYFALEKSTVFGLLGSNGAGKTTTLAMLTSDFISSKSVQSGNSTGTVKHTAYLNGNDIIEQSAECWKELGFCPQFDALNLTLTGRETLTLYCWLRGVSTERKLFVADLLNALGLEYAADRCVSSYSLGMRRRLSLGVALVGNPKVIIADECTSGVDAISRANIRLLLQQTCKNRALLITSHDLAEVEMLADTIGIMSRGEMKTIGSKNNLKKKLTHHHQLQLHIEAAYEDEVCVRVLSMLTHIQLPPELEFLCQSLSFYQQLAVKEIKTSAERGGFGDKSDDQQRIDSSPKNPHNYRKITQEELYLHPVYREFILQCRNYDGGCYITECRHATGIINVSRQLFTLSTLFKKIKQIQNKIKQLQTYSCSQVPLDQVFLEIVRRDEEFAARKRGKTSPLAPVHIQQLLQSPKDD